MTDKFISPMRFSLLFHSLYAYAFKKIEDENPDLLFEENGVKAIDPQNLAPVVKEAYDQLGSSLPFEDFLMQTTRALYIVDREKMYEPINVLFGIKGWDTSEFDIPEDIDTDKAFKWILAATPEDEIPEGVENTFSGWTHMAAENAIREMMMQEFGGGGGLAELFAMMGEDD